MSLRNHEEINVVRQRMQGVSSWGVRAGGDRAQSLESLVLAFTLSEMTPLEGSEQGRECLQGLSDCVCGTDLGEQGTRGGDEGRH